MVFQIFSGNCDYFTNEKAFVMIFYKFGLFSGLFSSFFSCGRDQALSCRKIGQRLVANQKCAQISKFLYIWL